MQAAGKVDGMARGASAAEFIKPGYALGSHSSRPDHAAARGKLYTSFVEMIILTG